MTSQIPMTSQMITKWLNVHLLFSFSITDIEEELRLSIIRRLRGINLNIRCEFQELQTKCEYSKSYNFFLNSQWC
jgi:hypothetical protein